MTLRFDLKELLKDKALEEKRRKKTERHLTQEDIVKLVQRTHKQERKRDVPDE